MDEKEELHLTSQELQVLSELDSRQFGFLKLRGSEHVRTRALVLKAVKYLEGMLVQVKEEERACSPGARRDICIDPKTYCKLGHFHLLLEDYAKAMSAYQKFYALEPDNWKDPLFLYGLGLCYYHYNAFECACSEPSRVIGALDLCFRRRRARSPLRGSPRAHQRIADPRIPEMVSAVEAPDRGLFTSAFEPPLSLSNLPPVSLRRFRTRLLLFCFVFQNVDTYDDGSGAGPVGRSRFCSCARSVECGGGEGGARDAAHCAAPFAFAYACLRATWFEREPLPLVHCCGDIYMCKYLCGID
ncbi:Histone demethylase UTY [Papilio machaon]|uniref:Histone demethylase UTY n=1 Tax=Papilio machaon TaxID=76193 RepID=A0A194R1S1_PAPMA|nr:Histone demethylase UTY [Papilio machaon]